MNKILIYAVIALCAFSFAAWQQASIDSLESEIVLMSKDYKALSLEKDTLAAELVESEESKKRLSNAIRQLDKTLAEREAKLLSSKQRLAELPDIQRGLRKTDAEFNGWSDAHVPVDLVRLLRNTRKGDSEN